MLDQFDGEQIQRWLDRVGKAPLADPDARAAAMTLHAILSGHVTVADARRQLGIPAPGRRAIADVNTMPLGHPAVGVAWAYHVDQRISYQDAVAQIGEACGVSKSKSGQLLSEMKSKVKGLAEQFPAPE